MNASKILVVAGALSGPNDTWLMQRRPAEKPHGGLWEFPGGKVEHDEMPVKALIRELREELGIGISESDCSPAAFAETRDPTADRPIVILLYILRAWRGVPRSLEGGRINWFTHSSIARLDKPPLDRELAAKLTLHG